MSLRPHGTVSVAGLLLAGALSGTALTCGGHGTRSHGDEQPSVGGATANSTSGLAGAAGAESACDPEQTRCDGVCTDLDSDSLHCGSCGSPCGIGTPCVQGQCGCPDGSLFCHGDCVDPQSDSDHCGACGSRCGGGSACIDGHCRCPMGTELCGSRCVDTPSREHCGGCDKTCTIDELCALDQCVPITQECPAGTLLCGTACIDTLNAPRHCGGCDAACGPSEACFEGKCTCPMGQQRCGGACTDTQASALHCGSCDTPCAAGQSCQNGQCVCTEPGAALCENGCTHLASDPRNCGTCGNACEGYPCTEGECRCPLGQSLCGDTCISTESDPQHCGGCDTTCPSGQACVLGQCSSEVVDGCRNTLAHSIRLREIALYQTGKVTVMRDGTAVTSKNRNADVVAAKPALLRAFVTLEPGWRNRIVSARLAIVNGDDAEEMFHKLAVSADSEDVSLATTFNFRIPGQLLLADTRYSIEIVECQDESGTLALPRFPEGGTTPLEPQEVANLKLELIPIVANGFEPRTDPDHLDALLEYVETMYPMPDIELSVGEPMTAASAIGTELGWDEVLQQLSQRHQQDDAANDVYYYGLLEPAETMDEYCPDGCTVGIAYITSASPSDRHYRVAMGVSYGDVYSAETIAHELGHSQGRDHAPCGGAADADPNFPYAGARLGWWGFAAPDELLPPDSRRDVMSYCALPWISDYTYQGLLERSVALGSGALLRSSAPAGRFRVILLGPRGPRWGMSPSRPVEPAGEPEAATILDATGSPIAQVVVYRMRMSRPGTSSMLVPEPTAGWHAIAIQGQPALSYAAQNQSSP